MTASESAAVLDLTGRPVIHSSKLPGRRISWQEFAESAAPDRIASAPTIMVEFAPGQFCAQGIRPLRRGGRTYERPALGGGNSARTIPAGAVMRPPVQPEKAEPLPMPEYWLDGRLCRFPKRWSDSRYRWRGWTIATPEPAERSMAELLRPLSAKAAPRHWCTTAREPVARVARRFPLTEECVSERLSPRHAAAAEWFFASLTDEAAELVGGARRSKPQSNDEYGGGGMVPMWSRNPLALWPTEIAWEQHHRLRKRFRTLGMLTHILLRALAGAEMRDLAPAWSIPQRHLAEAGRIRLRAALEVCARMQDRKTDTIPHREVLQIVQAACADCERLVATRRMRALRPANDNTPIRRAA